MPGCSPWRLLSSVLFLALLPLSTLATSLEDDFRSPPMAARPYVWWHWMENSVTRDGIRRDLRAMREASIGGATIITIASRFTNSVNSAMSYQNKEWWNLVTFAAAEAATNGLELGIENCPGFSTSGGPWIPSALSMKRVCWTATPVKGPCPFAAALPPPEAVRGFYRDIAVLAVPDGDPSPDRVVDVSDRLSREGRLGWDVPAGGWTLYRFGYTSTGKTTHPTPKDIQDRSLEVDKLSATAVNFHLDHVLPPLREHLGSLFGTTFRHILIDSYEAGDQNWTEDFRGEFRKRRGYDPASWLPVLAGRAIGGESGAARFRADMGQTVKDLFTENYFRVFVRRVHEAGLVLQLEPYGGPFDEFEAATEADVPMREFWNFRTHWMKPDAVGGYPEIAGAVGRALGRRVIATEAFTAMPFDAPFSESPRCFKNPADATFARGINRMVLHHWVHQPFAASLRPGMTMDFWGCHFGTCQTWYEPGKAFYAYLGRCQALLQRGEQVVDILSLEGRPSAAEFDSIPRRMFLEDLKLVQPAQPARPALALPSGRTYSVIRIAPDHPTSPAIERKIAGLRAAGVPVWDGSGSPADALRAAGHQPGFERVEGDPQGKILCCHRREGDVQFFFVANTGTNAVSVRAAFRVVGCQPEFWHPENLKIEDATRWMEKDGRTLLMLDFAPNQAFFVVFRRPARPPVLPSPVPSVPVPPPVEIAGPWRLAFPPGLGAPAAATFPRLCSLAESGEPGIRYFSGTVTYSTEVAVPKDWPGLRHHVALDLGDVRELARVRVNGHDLGVLWYPPFRIDVGDVLVAGTNTLEVEVTNTWVNRMIGDHREPDDCEWCADTWMMNKLRQEKVNVGRSLARIPDWAIANGPRPSTNRITFCVWDYYRADSPLVPSGLIGPVRLVAD